MRVESQLAGQTAKTVITCYSVLDRFFPQCGLFDLTEGIYSGNLTLPLEQAQANQHDYLLDQLHCKPGSRILDIGCGYGTLLARAMERGAKAVGITLSAEQAQHGRRAGLDVHQLDYRELGAEWQGTFDGVVANGSAEHFVQPADALAEKADDIYRQFFQVAHRLIDPRSAGRLVTTTIHFSRRPHPAVLSCNPFAFRRGSDAFHYALLARSFGGWYPVPGQLARCANDYFQLIAEVDGTDDYRRTSEEWLRRVRQALASRIAAKIALTSLPLALHHPFQFAVMLYALLISESWNWQFRQPRPPTRLLRQTWAYHPLSSGLQTDGKQGLRCMLMPSPPQPQDSEERSLAASADGPS